MDRPRPLAALAALVLGATPAAAPAQVYGLAARVNGAEITAERLERYFEERLGEKGRLVAGFRSPAAYTAMKREALDELVNRELLWQEAVRRKRLVPREELDAAMARFQELVPDPTRRRLQLERAGFTEETYAQFVRRELSIRLLVERDVAPKVKVTDKDVRDFHGANQERFTEPPAVRARHVLVKVSPDAEAARREEARQRIEAVHAAAVGGSDFADLARRHSEDSTASAGGDLGFFVRGQMVRPFEDAAFALDPGQVSSVVETPFGYHVLRVEARRPERVTPFAEVKEPIRAQLRAERIGQEVAKLVAELRAKAKIEILMPLGEGK